MNWLLLSAETPGVIRDDNGVPVEWTLLKIGENNFCQNGKDGVISLSAEGAGNIIQYHNKKGELIPVDSEHYLFELAEKHKLDETEQDVKEFVERKMSRMVVSVQHEDGKIGKFTLTKKNTGDTLSPREIEQRFDNAIRTNNSEFEAWKEALNGTCYEIRDS